MQLPTEFALQVGAHLQVTFDQYTTLTKWYEKNPSIGTLRNILLGIHTITRGSGKSVAANHLGITRYSPSLVTFAPYLNLFESGLNTMGRFVETHPQLRQLGSGIHFRRKSGKHGDGKFLVSTIKYLASIFQCDFTTGADDYNVYISFEGEMATYSTNVLRWQLRDTAIIQFKEITNNLNIFDSTLYPGYANLKRVIGPRFIYTGTGAPLGDIISTYRFEGGREPM